MLVKNCKVAESTHSWGGGVGVGCKGDLAANHPKSFYRQDCK